MTKIGEETIFSLVAGRHHGPECWLYVQDELSQRGFSSIAPNLPIEDPDATLDDHARILARKEQDSQADKVIRVGWSWAANVIPRITYETPVEGLVFFAGAFHSSTLQNHGGREVPQPKHTLTYDAMEKALALAPAGQNPDPDAIRESAENAFYHDVEDKMLISLIIGGLRSHPRRQSEPKLKKFPKLPMEYVVLQNDKAFIPASQEQIAISLGIKPLYLESGHAPMLSEERAKKLADLLIEFAARQNSNRMLHLQV